MKKISTKLYHQVAIAALFFAAPAHAYDTPMPGIPNIPGVTTLYNPTGIPLTAQEVVRSIQPKMPVPGIKNEPNQHTYAGGNPINRTQRSGLSDMVPLFYDSGVHIEIMPPQPPKDMRHIEFIGIGIGLISGVHDLGDSWPPRAGGVGNFCRAGADIHWATGQIIDLIERGPPHPGYVARPYNPLYSPPFPNVGPWPQ